MVELTIYLLCYNEEVLLPPTLKHYKTRFPNAKIVIIDNQSTDKSVEIALEAGCEIHTWDTKNIANIIENTTLKNNIWKSANTDWVLIADMDEWLELTEKQLTDDDKAGVTIIRTSGVQIVADSMSLTLDDIDLHALRNGYRDKLYSKTVCFKRSEITEINYVRGAHTSSPKGKVIFNKNAYVLKHMNYLGFVWYQAKMKARYLRTDYNRNKLRCSGHYSNNDKVITDRFNTVKAAAVINII
jgi:glycosyltransferase involved in cell wall biosynthesis